MCGFQITYMVVLNSMWWSRDEKTFIIKVHVPTRVSWNWAYGHAKLELVGMSLASSNGHKYAYYQREYPNTTVNALFL